MSSWQGKSAKPPILLPWERRHGWSALGPFSGRYAAWLLLPLALCVLLFAAWQISDRRARVRATRQSVAEVKRAIAAFRADLGRCPRSVAELLQPPPSTARYLDKPPRDAWGRELYVRCPAAGDVGAAEVVSAGPSGAFSDEDNIF